MEITNFGANALYTYQPRYIVTDNDIKSDDIDEQAEFNLLFGNELEDGASQINLTVCPNCEIKLEKGGVGKEEMWCPKCGLTERVHDIMGGGGDNFMIIVTGPNAAKYKSSIHKDSNLPKDEVKYNNVLKLYTLRNKGSAFKFSRNILMSATDIYCNLTTNITYRAEKCKQLMGACLFYQCCRERIYRPEINFADFMATNKDGISMGKIMMDKLSIGKMKLTWPDEAEYTVIMHFTQLGICDEEWNVPMHKIIDIIRCTLKHNISPQPGQSTVVTRSAATIKYYNKHVSALHLTSGVCIDDVVLKEKIGVTSTTFNKFYEVLLKYPNRIDRILKSPIQTVKLI